MGLGEKANMQHSSSQSVLPNQLPPLLKSIQPIASKITPDLFRKILKVVLKDIEGVNITEENFDKLRALFPDLQEDELVTLYAGVLQLMRTLLRYPSTSIKKEHVHKELVELQLPETFVDDICAVVFGERRLLTDDLRLQQQLRVPSLASFRWRVDVTISTSSLNRVLEPSLLMRMETSEGKVSTFEVSQSKFHQLRYNVSYLLQQMEELEKKTAPL